MRKERAWAGHQAQLHLYQMKLPLTGEETRSLDPAMATPLERYQQLGLRDSLLQLHRYSLACKELSFILRRAYNNLPKNLQADILQDTLSAFRLLPTMQISSAVTAAHLLIQSSEAALPKQKKNLAIAAYKQAMVAHKRQYKQRHEEKGNFNGSSHLPKDALLYIFSFLDMQSLVSVGLVCRSWNLAASDNHLWQLQYATFFGSLHNISRVIDEEEQEVASRNCIDWKEAFKSEYEGHSSRKLTLHRGFCVHCKTIVWLSNTKCPNKHHELNGANQQVKPVSPFQVVEYLLHNSLELMGSSDSDSDSDPDECLASSFWAFPSHTRRRCK